MNQNYYVDAVSGQDKNDGRSPETAWHSLRKVNAVTFEPGDHLLFKAGCKWVGQLHPLGSGSEEQPIWIGRYSEGHDPIICGDGSTGMTAGAVVLLFNQDFWNIEHLTVTHPADEEGERFGILVRWHDYGLGRHIHIRSNTVSHIKGYKPFRFKGDGIMVIATGSTTVTHIDDILIENNTLTHIDRTGITVWNQFSERGRVYFRDLRDGDYQYHTTVGPYTPHTNVVIRGNVLDTIAGDGILLTSCDHAIIDHNLASNCNNYNGYHYQDANVAIWPQNCDDVVMQYNEAYLTHSTSDGQGFDIDFECYRPIMQYNYSHDNEGGFMLLMEEVFEPMVRYNVSRRDGCALLDNRSVHNGVFHGNRFYLSSGKLFRGESRGNSFTGNLFFSDEPLDAPDWSEDSYRHNYYSNVRINPSDPLGQTYDRTDEEPFPWPDGSGAPESEPFCTVNGTDIDSAWYERVRYAVRCSLREESRLEVLTKECLEAQTALLREYAAAGLVLPVGTAAWKAALERVNEARTDAYNSGEILYGPIHYTLDTYIRYVLHEAARRFRLIRTSEEIPADTEPDDEPGFDTEEDIYGEVPEEIRPEFEE